MTATPFPDALQLRSRLGADGQVEVSVRPHPVDAPAADEVVVRIEAAPLNPSDIGLMLAGAELTGAAAVHEGDMSRISATAPPGALKAMAGRLDTPIAVGNEGAGVVVATGDDPAALALLGRTVAVYGGGMYAQFRTVKAQQCLRLPEDVTADMGAGAFINPLTVLGMTETMRREGHSALVHTAAASNLGQMLVKLCRADGVPLVNIVRSPQQVELLRTIGATHVCDSSAPDFLHALTEAIAETGATLAFDAVGGGKLAGRILSCMERAILRRHPVSDLYGSPVHKQLYVYGGLDVGATELVRTFGLAWGMGGWLVFPFLQRIGPEATQALTERIAREIKTTFASRYAGAISLRELLDPAIAADYMRRATGEKFLVKPWLGA